MRKWLTAFAFLTSVLVPTLVVTGPAQAAPDQVFVDPNVGIDGNPCTAGSPCLTLDHAGVVVADSGTITVLSSGVLTPTTITKGITINCPRVTCLIDSSANANGGTGTTAVTINAPGKTVQLVGVSVTGFGTGLVGVTVSDVDKLYIRGGSISGEATCLSFTPSTAASSHLVIDDEEIHNCSSRNVSIAPTSSNSASVLIRGSKVHHAQLGIFVDATAGTGGVSLVLVNSFVGFQNNNSVLARGNAGGGAPARILIDSSSISYSSGNCVFSFNATATISLTKTQVTQCTQALNSTNGGGLFTYGDNAIHFNTADGNTPTTAGGFR
jgi:hypothetical protein